MSEDHRHCFATSLSKSLKLSDFSTNSAQCGLNWSDGIRVEFNPANSPNYSTLIAKWPKEPWYSIDDAAIAFTKYLETSNNPNESSRIHVINRHIAFAGIDRRLTAIFFAYSGFGWGGDDRRAYIVLIADGDDLIGSSIFRCSPEMLAQMLKDNVLAPNALCVAYIPRL